MSFTVRFAVRDWDYITPLVLKDVYSPHFELQIKRVNTLLNDFSQNPNFDVAELSFSRYSQSRLCGKDAVVGVPHFLMRGFRHRCIITTTDSSITKIVNLANCRIGLTGWADSGNIWTRAILRQLGINIENIKWIAGRLTSEHPITDRLEGFGKDGFIEASPNEKPLIDMLKSGEIEAVFTPFMPPGFFNPKSGLRPLLANYRQSEVEYFHQVGYVPGIHLLGIKANIVDKHPWLPQALSELISESARLWQVKREKYADTTPWIVDEIQRCAQDLPNGWDTQGLSANKKMILSFCEELFKQGITPRQLVIDDLFPREN